MFVTGMILLCSEIQCDTPNTKTMDLKTVYINMDDNVKYDSTTPLEFEKLADPKVIGTSSKKGILR